MKAKTQDKANSTQKAPRRTASDEPPVSNGRHEFRCTICPHEERESIEAAFVGWQSPVKIASDYKISRDSIYRHAKATGLSEKRRKNVRAALERIIEKAGEVEVNANAVVAAITAYAKINARGELVERHEMVDVNALFERMSSAEAEVYVKTGVLPQWFAMATAGESQSEADNG